MSLLAATVGVTGRSLAVPERFPHLDQCRAERILGKSL